ncbi:MAG: hypothetical protein ABGX20_18775 [Bacillus sp. (in: firmicutes)]
MYLFHDMKEMRYMSDRIVECPILGCNNTVPRQTSSFLCEPQFLCKEHQIYISLTTFEYADVRDNLLWRQGADVKYLLDIKGVKRECRMARERSEDALTWNVFRYLQNHDLISQTLERFTGELLVEPEVIYWSYSAADKGVSSLLKAARKSFRESAGTEPDIIINSKHHIIFVEAKFTSGNETRPKREAVLDKYLAANDGWYQQVFQKDIRTVCVDERKYELMRNYLLGTWLAEQHNKKFTLLTLTGAKYGRDSDLRFRDCIIENDQFRYIYSYWEELRGVIQNHLPDSLGREIVLDYLSGKTAGYRGGRLVRAFM